MAIGFETQIYVKNLKFFVMAFNGNKEKVCL